MKMFRLHFPSPAAIMHQSIYVYIHSFISPSRQVLPGTFFNIC